MDIEILQRALQREKHARKQAEKILEDKSRELYTRTQELKKVNAQLEDVLIEKKSELKGVFDNLVDAYVLIDVFGNAIKFNDAAKKLFGYDIDKETLNVTSLIYKGEHTYALESFKTLVKQGSFSDYTARVHTKNNGVRWVHINASIITNKDGIAIGAQGIVKDITEQLRIEEENKKLVHDLEKNNIELKEYAHIVSHDLKSPLRSINALVNWIEEDYSQDFDETGKNHLTMINKTVSKMEMLIDGILTYSSAGNETNLQHIEVNINETINDILSTIYIPDHITVHCLQPLPTINADKIRIQQLFQNIISNAVNYIDKPQGIIEIDYEDHNNYYIFKIKDNGIGIQKEYHEKIFKIFQSLGDHENSTGIGLSIVKKIVALYNGKIWLESKPGIGTTFFFSLTKTQNNDH
ncbi:ATP-binding protein [Aquimarina sp. W85]|uniref:sensor histidine kinase n=1 Tax=Aquimarina rhodophyticola TaxID=3342246 RepID=UPI0036710872